MRIVYLAAGAAGMYCGSCLHDNTLAAGLKELGHEILLVPTYTPLRTDEENLSLHRVFFGGINVYLQQKSAIFRHTPWFVDKLFDFPTLVDWLARRSVSTNPADLGDLTTSMLAGESGQQRKELDKLVYWLETEAKPDVVHLSNSMLIGMARQMKERLGCPIVSSLSGEDIFLEKLVEPFYSSARRLLRERAPDVDAYVALNNYYAEFMADYLSVDSARVQVISHGLNLTGHDPVNRRDTTEYLTIGFFARICSDKGLHLLAEAFRILNQKHGLHNLRFRAAGYLGESDRPYLDAIRRRIDSWGLSARFEYAGELDRAGKISFLQSLDVMSVPTTYRESKGISVLEAMANKVAVVVPGHGTFPELIDDTRGGLQFEPNNPDDLADKLARLLQDVALRSELADHGYNAIHNRYHHRLMAERHVALYENLLSNQRTR